MNAAGRFFGEAMRRLAAACENEAANVEAAATICAGSIAAGGLVFLFGAGHSRMMCEEMTPRQGCFVGFYALVEHAVSNHTAIVGENGLRGPLFLEKVEGYAEEILKSFRFGPHDAFLLISTSGIRPLIVEMGLGAKQRGMPLVGMCSREHCEESRPAHSSGKKLVDIADVLIDNHAPRGDCLLELEGLDWRTGPVSTITGAMLMNMLRVATAEKLLERGHKPVLLPSHQMVGNTNAQQQLEQFYEEYRKSLAHLYRP